MYLPWNSWLYVQDGSWERQFLKVFSNLGISCYRKLGGSACCIKGENGPFGIWKFSPILFWSLFNLSICPSPILLLSCLFDLSICRYVCLYVYQSTCLPVYLNPSLLLGQRPSTTVCQRSCFGPSFLIGSLSGQSFWCQPRGQNTRCSLVVLSLPYPGDSSKGPVLWHLMLVCEGCALSISIFAMWFHLLLVFGCSPTRGCIVDDIWPADL